MKRLTDDDIKFRSKQFAKALVKHKGDKAKAWHELFPKCTPKTAVEQASRHITKYPQTKTYITEAFDKHGVSIDYAIKNIKGLCKHKKPFIYNNKLLQVDDGTVQLNANVAVLKAHGAIQSDGSKTTNNIQNNLNVDAGAMEQLNSRIEKVLTMFNLNETSEVSLKDKSVTAHSNTSDDKDIVDV